MYNKDSILFDINMITKLICYILFTIFILVNNNIIIFILIEVLMLIETRKEKISTKFNLITLLLFIISFFIRQIIFIPKLLLIITYTYLLTKVVNLGQLRYLIEITFYKYKNNKLTKFFLKAMYYVKYIKVYTLKYKNLRKAYGFNSSIWYKIFSLKKAHNLTKQKIKELVKINEIRFYNYYSKKTYLEKIKFERWDYFYIFIHIFLIVISFTFRR